MSKKKVSIVGSGNWASAIALVVGENCKKYDIFEDDVRMWTYEEMIEGRKLTEIINTQHENVKYMPGVKLPENIIADPDVLSATKDAHVLIFVLPHQFLPGLCDKIAGNHAPDCIAISLIKSVLFEEHGITLISEQLRKGLKGMDVSVLMGANVASEVAAGAFCETTIGYNIEANGKLCKQIFETPLFRVSIVNDIAGVEMCGALKNAVALAAGFVEGLDLPHNNTKAAIIRIGLMEMKKFIGNHFPGVKEETFFQSCGFADLVVTCYAGRNRKCALEFVKAAGTKTFDQIEVELLHGQKLEGTQTCKEVMKIMRREGSTDRYPLFSSIHAVAFEGASVQSMIDTLGHAEM